ncbi:MAG TPA: AAA family ATPase [Terracidiphilus sp.]|jgi:hypothetical protein|nr:AAA family ATPase [Terracidiphilus sp.]
MRKLTVKNFSVIKHAELEFGKITVLIGPQASGKSLLCKLAYFFQKTLFDLAGNHAVALQDPDRWETFVNDSFQKSFCAFFPTYSWGRESFRIEYQDGGYHPQILRDALATNGLVINSPGSLCLSFLGGAFRKVFDEFGESLKEALREVPPSNQSARLLENTYLAGRRLQDIQSDPMFSVHSYVPDTRTIFSTYNPSYAAARIGSADPVVIAFSRQVDYEFRKSFPSQAKIECIRRMDEESRAILGGELVFDEGDGLVRFRENDGRQLPLTELSSGTRELVPLLTHLRQYVFDENADFPGIIGRPSSTEAKGPLPERLVFVEEPEANVFPTTQYNLVRLFAWMAKEERINLSWVITTHSPYILTAFNDLIKAGYIASERPEKASKIDKIVPRQFWIEPADFAAYAFDGKDSILHPIMDSETKLIDGDILDDISGRIGAEFEELLEIQYGS